MKSFFNFLKRNKLYALINLLGLTISMAFVLLLAVYVRVCAETTLHRCLPRER